MPQPEADVVLAHGLPNAASREPTPRPLLRGQRRVPFIDQKPRSTRITLCGRPPWSDEAESQGPSISHVFRLIVSYFPVRLLSS
jgi:hypothetical protein